MKESVEVEKYVRACQLLPERLSIPLLDISRERMACVEEIRLRIGREISLTMPDGEIPLPQTRVIAEDLEQVIDRATEFSRYMAQETIRMESSFLLFTFTPETIISSSRISTTSLLQINSILSVFSSDSI